MLDPEHLPRIVFVTAYDEFAITAFDNQAFDYLLKPINEQRLAQAIAKVRKDIAAKSPQPLPQEPLKVLPIYSGNRLKVVSLNDVEYVMSDLSGVHVATASGIVHTQMTLKLIEQKPLWLPSSIFVSRRCHCRNSTARTGRASVCPQRRLRTSL